MQCGDEKKEIEISWKWLVGDHRGVEVGRCPGGG